MLSLPYPKRILVQLDTYFSFTADIISSLYFRSSSTKHGMAGPFSTAQISRWYLLSFFFLGSLSIGMMLLIVVELQRTVSRGGEPPQTLATYARVPPPPPRSGQQPQRQHRRFRGTFSNPEVLWAQSNKVAWKHYQIAAEDGPCSCAGKKHTWDACPGPSRSLINATLQDGVYVSSSSLDRKSTRLNSSHT